MANKIMSVIDTNVKTTSTNVYLDMAAELSKVDRKNHKQVSDNGKAIVYDLLVSIATPQNGATTNSGLLDCQTFTAPLNWQTRNSVKMAHELRKDLRKEAGVVKGSIGRYAKNLRLNIDSTMQNITYEIPVSLSTASSQRMYANSNLGTTALGTNPKWFSGGVWDYSKLSVFDEDPLGGGASTAYNFDMVVCGAHVGAGTTASPWTTVATIQAYNERRQTVLDDSTLTPGGDTQFVENNSPFFRVPETDVSETAYVAITLDEQDNPPYSRQTGATDDSQMLQSCDYFTLPEQVTVHSYRIQAPLGLVKFVVNNSVDSQLMSFEIECLGIYEM
ncbi:MAG: hypothetical protein [Circular genetic element sp.]|nr:MAG: hypothetical protein [Circular genetic element sp.]